MSGDMYMSSSFMPMEGQGIVASRSPTWEHSIKLDGGNHRCLVGGVIWEGRIVCNVWKSPWGGKHISILELRAVHLALRALFTSIWGRYVLISTASSSTVFHINHYGDLLSSTGPFPGEWRLQTMTVTISCSPERTEAFRGRVMVSWMLL